jgi:hypothetical protein
MGEIGEMGEMFVVTTSVVILILFVVTTSVVAALLGSSQVTPRYQEIAPVPNPAGDEPSDCSCYGGCHNTRATTEVGTLNISPISPFSPSAMIKAT